MTTNTAAAQAADPEIAQYNLAEEDRQILALNENEEFFSNTPSNYGFGPQYHSGIPGVLAFARAAHALLSKLRTPVADEQEHLNRVVRIACQIPGSSGDKTARLYDELRAALASAPVAGEAQPVAVRTRPRHGDGSLLSYWTYDDFYAHAPVLSRIEDERGIREPLYAAPQASEAVPLTPDWANYQQGWADGLAEGNEALDIARTALMEIADLTDVEADHRGVIVNAALTRIDEITSRAALSAQPGALFHLDTGPTEPDNDGPVVKADK